MPEPCVPVLPDTWGQRLDRGDYRREFRERDAAIHGKSSWKIERRQHFEEIGNASRDAFRDGDMANSLRLLEERREAIRRAVADDESRDSRFHRVRIVEEPFTPYLRWQLHSLRVRAECGERIRVVRGLISGVGAEQVVELVAIRPDSTSACKGEVREPRTDEVRAAVGASTVGSGTKCGHLGRSP